MTPEQVLAKVEAVVADGADSAQLLAVLEQLADVATAQQQLMDRLWAARLQLFDRLRSADPPVPQKVIAQHAKVSEGAVTQAVRKLREAAAS